MRLRDSRLLGKRHFKDPIDLFRAYFFTVFVFLCLPMPIVNGVLYGLKGVPPPFITLSVLPLSVLAYVLVRKNKAQTVVRLLFCLVLELFFIESALFLDMPSMFIGLSMVPFITVLVTGKRRAWIALLLPIAFAFRIHPPIALPNRGPLFPRLETIHSFNPDSVNVVVLTGIMYFAAISINKIFLMVYKAYLAERELTKGQIRARRRKERQLADSLALLRSMLRAIPVPVLVKESDGRYSYASKAAEALFDLGGTVIPGKRPDQVFPPEAIARIQEMDEELARTGMDQHRTLRIPARDGRILDLIIHKVPFLNMYGNGAGQIIVLVDETDRVAREEELETLLAKNREALAVLGHDMKNPIGSFRNLVRLMEQDADPDPQEYREVLGELHKNLDALYVLLEDLLSWARSEENLGSFQARSMPFMEIFEKVRPTLELQAEAKGIRLVLDAPEDLEIYADERMLETILRNVVGNAVKFSFREGSIHIRAHRDSLKRCAVLSVQDDGVGLTQEKIAEVFSAKPIVGGRGTEGEGGTGFGLVVCGRFIRRHGGDFSIDSAEGKGSAFTFTFPDPEDSEARSVLG